MAGMRALALICPELRGWALRLEARRRLDRLIWKRRALVASATALGVAVVGAVYFYVYWPDPVVETRIVSGMVTDWTNAQTKYRETNSIVISVLLDDGRKIIITQRTPDVLLHGPAEIEERGHKSGRKSYLWLRPKPN
jgi:hypothetical protein